MKNVDIAISGIQGDINLGSILRLMQNFDLGQLHLVKPDAPMGEHALNFACRGQTRLQETKVWDSFAEATSQSHDLILATTARFGKDRQVVSLHDLADLGERLQRRVLLVFGREDHGLYREEVARCHAAVHIPLMGEYPSLNLSHAVAMVLYELHRLRNPEISTGCVAAESASARELSVLEDSVTQFLNSFGYFEKKERHRESEELARLLKAHPYTSEQVRFVLGLLRGWRNRHRLRQGIDAGS